VRLNKAWLAVGLIVAALATSGALEAAEKKKPKPPPPIPSDESLGFYNNTRDELLANIKRVGVMPVMELPVSIRDEREDAKPLLQEAVMKYLRLANMDVVGPQTYQAAFDRFNKQLGGMYDATTGELKREIAAAVLQNARREFASKERLDAFVFIRVSVTAAPYSADYAVWDGVHERADGKPAPKNALVEFWTSNDSKGSIPALSMLVQIVSTQERVLYGRRGGIQPSAYHDTIEGSNASFAFVASEDQLKDLERIDRAARVATLPLIRTPKEISLGSADPAINAARIDLSTLPLLPPGQAFKNESPLLVPRDQILQSVKRVALSPVDPEKFNVPADVQQRLVDGIKQELAPLNWEIIDAPRARELLIAELLKTQLSDPMTGKRDAAKASGVRKSVFKALGITPTPDAILWVGLQRSTVLHRYGDVEWDGANQSGLTLGPVVKKIFGGSWEPGAGSGSIAAASLTAYLADANDTPLYRGRGGLQLVQKLKYSPPGYSTPGRAEPEDLAASELFRDPSRELPAVHAALRDLVMTPEALALELNPPKDSKKKKKKA